MTDADDDIRQAVAALRVKNQPAAEDLAAAPILDGWYFYHPFGDPLKGVGAKGVVSNDARFADGSAIFTSKLRAVDGLGDRLGDGEPAWVRTQNTLYALGWPREPWPPVLEVALSATWTNALMLAGACTGEHTLPPAVVATYDAVRADTMETTCAGTSPDWALRRTGAAAIAGALAAAGRTSVAAAWQVLAVNARKHTDAKAVSALLEAAARDVTRTPQIEVVLAGWTLLGNGTSLGEDLADPVRAAQRIGERHTRNAGTDGEEPPLLVRMVLAPDWWSAAEILLAEAPQTRLGTAVPFVRGAGTPQELRQTAWSLFKACRDQGEPDRADGWRLLAVDPADRDAIAWVIDELTLLQRAAAPPSDLAWAHDLGQAIRGWQLLAGAHGPLTHADDAIAGAWEMHAGHVHGGAGGDAASTDRPRFQPDEPASEPKGAGVVVLPAVGGTSETSSGRDAVREFKPITGEKLPLVLARDLARARAVLRDEFPHLHAAVDVLLTGLVEGEPVQLRHSLLVGEAGGGKSRLARRVAESLGVPLHRFDGSGSSDNTFGGTPRRWSSGEHCVPLEAVRRHRVSNPMVLVDEIDKAGASHHNGALVSALLPFLEPENARTYPDPYVQAEVDLAHVNYILTCNDDSVLPAPLKDRLRIIRLPRPTIAHLPALARGIVADIAKERGGDARFFPGLNDPELAVAEALWARGGSVRRLRAIVERLLAYREERPRQ